MNPRLWRSLPLIAAVLVVLVALGMPSPDPAAVPTVPATGPVRLADVWPAAKPITLAAELADGYMLQPLLVVDAGMLLGLATSPDVTTARLVLRSSDGTLRDLRVYRGPDRPTVAGVTMAGSDIFWIETGADESGARVTTVWRASPVSARSELASPAVANNADSAAAAARMVAGDASDLLYYDSGYDLQVADGRLHWAAAAPDGKRGELHSVSIDGGPVTVRTLPAQYALTAWPWASYTDALVSRDVHLLNLVTGEERTVKAGADEIVTCTPTWCRIVTLYDQRQTAGIDIAHPDGSGRRRIGGPTLSTLNTDIALLDRFEVLASSGAGESQQLWLRDLTNDRLVLLDDLTATVASRGSYVWWSTGDNETLTWHALDLRQLS